MSTATIEWKILQTRREAVDGYIFNVSYSVSASNGLHLVDACASIDLDRPEELIPYDQLAENTIILWIKEKLGVEAKGIESELLSRLELESGEQSLPGLPWQ